MSQNYTSQDLSSRDLSGRKDLKRARFTNCNLHSANLNYCDLRGCDFTGANLLGATLDGCNLHGAKFTCANAVHASFDSARMGLTPAVAAAFKTISFACNFLGTFGAVSILSLFITATLLVAAPIVQILGALGLAVCAAVLVVFARLGLTPKSAVAFGIAVAAAFLFGGGVLVPLLYLSIAIGVFGTAVELLPSLAGASVSCVLLSLASARMRLPSAQQQVFTQVITQIGLRQELAAHVRPRLVAGVLLSGIIIMAWHTYVASRLKRRHSNFELLRTAVVWLKCRFGTRFTKANLTGASFARARVEFADFSAATLKHTIWRQAQNLDESRIQHLVLSNSAFRSMLVTGSGRSTDLVGADLCELNLDEFDLRCACLQGANLRDATVRGADLQQAILTEANCTGTDFAGANLTGACIEAWNIDAETRLSNIECGFVFLRQFEDERGNRERRPHDPGSTFQKGDFEKLYTKIRHTVEILLRSGTTRQSLRAAFEQLIEEFPEVNPESVLSIERRGEDLLLKMLVPESTDKGLLERSLREALEAQRQLETKAQLLAAHNQTLTDLALAAMRRRDARATIQVGGSIVHERKEVSVGRDLTIKDAQGIAVIGNVDFKALSSSSSENVRELAERLSEIETMIRGSSQLSADDKLAAHQQIAAVASAAQKVSEPESRTQVKVALGFLKSLTNEIPTIAKLLAGAHDILHTMGLLTS